MTTPSSLKGKGEGQRGKAYVLPAPLHAAAPRLKPLGIDTRIATARQVGAIVAREGCIYPVPASELGEGCENAVAPSELPIRVAGVLPLAHLGSRFSPVEQEVAS